jgi:rhodanese-related sulfurtransferase
MFNLFTKTDYGFNNILCEELESILGDTNISGKHEIIDVRTDGEFAMGHIPESKLYNLIDPAFREKINGLDRNKTYYVYCQSGSRSMSACRLMADLGFKDVNNIKFGLMGWRGPLV